VREARSDRADVANAARHGRRRSRLTADRGRRALCWGWWWDVGTGACRPWRAASRLVLSTQACGAGGGAEPGNHRAADHASTMRCRSEAPRASLVCRGDVVSSFSRRPRARISRRRPGPRAVGSKAGRSTAGRWRGPGPQGPQACSPRPRRNAPPHDGRPLRRRACLRARRALLFSSTRERREGPSLTATTGCRARQNLPDCTSDSRTAVRG
jgi:hypothetical protein